MAGFVAGVTGAFRNTGELIKLATKGVKAEAPVAGAAKSDIRERAEIVREIVDGTPFKGSGDIELSGIEAMATRWAVRRDNGAVASDMGALTKDAMSVGLVAATGVVGFKATQAGVSLLTGDW